MSSPVIDFFIPTMSQSSSYSAREASRALIEPLLNEHVDRYVLPNGLTVVLKQSNAAAICSVQAWVKTGSIHEGKLLGAGVSHFVEHMLFKGTSKRQSREISESVQSGGGYINAYTTFDRTVYYIDMPSENVDVALDILSDCVFNSTLPEEEVEKEREVILREIDMGEDDPDSKLSHALFETVFRQHSYRYPIIGYKSVFEQVSRQELWDYYKERYVPNNMVLVVCGDFRESALKASINSMFGVAPRAALTPVYLPQEPMQLAERSQKLYEDVQVSRIGIGFQVPGLTDEDTPALDTLSMILGNGNSSLFNLHLREKCRLVHQVDSSNWTPGSVGVFYIAMMADPDKCGAAISEIRSFLEGLRAEDFTVDQVSKAVRQLLVSEINSRKTVSGQASRLGSSEVVVGDIGYAKNYLDSISNVDPKQVFEVLKKWLRWDRVSLITLDPKESEAKESESKSVGPAGLDFEEIVQKNGSTLLLRQDKRLPNLHFRLAMEGGALFEDADTQGLTALTSNLLTKDTEKRTSEEVSDAIEGVGGSFYEFSGNNSLGLALEVLPTDLDLALDLIEQAIFHSLFKDETFEIEKEAHIAAIKEQNDDIVAAGRRALRRRFFGDHPFAIGGGGSVETVEPIQREDLVAHWEKLCVASNFSLAISGDFDPEVLRPKVETLMANLKVGVLKPAVIPTDFPAEPGVHREKMERNQAIVYHGYPGTGLKGDDFFVSEVADELFSGMSSKLFERVRDELSLAYFVRSSRIIGLDTSLFYFYAGTSPERYEEVVAELIREVERVANGEVEQDEIDRCKVRLKASRRMSMQTNSSCASQAAMNVAYGLPVNDWQNYDARIEAVGLEGLQQFAKTYFDSSKRVELVIGPNF